MFADLVSAARDLRSPLAAGYSLLFTAWLLLRDQIADAAQGSGLLGDLHRAIATLGGATELALFTFTAAMVGTTAWNMGLARLVDGLQRALKHPDWSHWIAEAQQSAKYYEEYSLGSEAHSYTRMKRNSVPSRSWGDHLQSEVEERRRKKADVEFRLTLAISLVPVALVLGVEGGGYWWFAFVLPAILWFDTSLTKYTTAALIREYKIHDLERRLAEHFDGRRDKPETEQSVAFRTGIETELALLKRERTVRRARLFGLIHGPTRARDE